MSRVAICTAVTFNHLHTALNFVRAIRRTWRTAPPIFIALVDHVDRARPGFEHISDVEFISPDTLDVPNLPWLLSKLSPAEVCCMLKPFVVRRLIDEGFDTILYADSDIHFFADGGPFVASIGAADFLVTPHLMSPLPFAEPWTRSTMGHLATGGVLNAGLFVARSTAGARQFIENWGRLCVGPGAFLSELGGTHEQQFFNWVYAFSDNVRFCRDPRVNVAYWNLHERPIRWGGLDGQNPELWYLDDQPIVCFHFSGFAWARGRLTDYDDRARPYMNANLFAIGEYYARELARSGQGHYEPVPYEFGHVQGLPLDRYIRTELKRAERRGTPRTDEWSSGGPAALRRLNETLSDASLVPRFLESVQTRYDLARFHDHLFSREWLRWVEIFLWSEHEIQGQIYERFGPFLYDRVFLNNLALEIGRACPTMEVSEVRELLRRDRPRLLRQLTSHAVPDAIMAAVQSACYRAPAFVPAIAVRLLYVESPQLQERFPDLSGADFFGFKQCLGNAGHSGDAYEYPDSVRAFLTDFDFERSVARVIGKSVRIPSLVDEIRQTRYDRAHLVPLVAGAQSGWGYGPDDLVVTDWWLQLLGDRARRRVRELVPPDPGEDGFTDYLEAWCRGRGIVDSSTPRDVVVDTAASLERSLLVVAGDGPGLTHLAVRDHGVREKLVAALQPEPRGVNVFGYFKSPIGLGAASRGLCRALEIAGYEHQDLVIPNDAMDADVALDDLFQDFSFNYPRNIVVSYPHIEYQLQSVRPRCFFAGRETIGYFAWEQRDFPAAWTGRLAPFDRLCALSRFSAESISRGVNRPVDVLPCVVETGAAVPKEAARERFGIPRDKFVIGYVFDAASSIERKNPWAFVDAVEKAFGGSRDVAVVMKIGSGWRFDFASQVRELERRLPAVCPGSIVITDYLPKRDVETLICAMDVYVSLHRCEGFGYTLAEAMLLGVPAVATRYSGNLDFMTDGNSYLVNCREVPVRTREGPFETGTVWAEPDIDHAVALLREIHGDYSSARARAVNAVADLSAVVSPAAVARAASAVIEGAQVGKASGLTTSPLMLQQ
jgi:glycosyltransferase involved in cell wall biosynthesis